MDIDALAKQMMPYAVTAVGAYGAAVLTRTEDAAAQLTVRIGQRILQRLVAGGPARPGIEQAVVRLATAGPDPGAQAALQAQIGQALSRDGALAMQIAALLPQRPSPPSSSAVAYGARAMAIGRDNTGLTSSGDAALNIGGPVHGQVTYHHRQGWEDPASSMFKAAADRVSRKAKWLILLGALITMAGVVIAVTVFFNKASVNMPDINSPNFDQAMQDAGKDFFGRKVLGLPEDAWAMMMIFFGQVMFIWGLVTLLVAYYRKRKAAVQQPTYWR